VGEAASGREGTAAVGADAPLQAARDRVKTNRKTRGSEDGFMMLLKMWGGISGRFYHQCEKRGEILRLGMWGQRNLPLQYPFPPRGRRNPHKPDPSCCGGGVINTRLTTSFKKRIRLPTSPPLREGRIPYT